MRQLTRSFAALTSAVLVMAMTQPGASGQPPAPGGSQHVDTHAVTLITGDTVTLTKTGDGRQAASVSAGKDRQGVNYTTVENKGDLYVVPDDAQRLLAENKLDKELFNVTRLVRDGYDDGSVDGLPLIVDYGARGTTRLAQPAPQASSKTHTLASIGAVAVSADKDRTESFWTDIRPRSRSAGLDDGIAKVWLDGKATVSLDVSVPQIGAPQMWQAGYDGTGVKVAVLDTGVDAGHPDLAGEIDASQSFVPGQTVADGHGHGTHVASTIAGSGAGAGGRYKGVAPGADLLVGKVLDNSGSGLSSWIIAGMEWAVASGADVVSMSLGGTAYEPSDPLSQAVDQLSASSNALFVIAAGNDGPGEQTVGSPGIADSALTVGAVSKTEVLASFSSRGPRVGDYAVKPEITAPGVAIVAARAAGTALGTPVNDLYTSANGTSMATPHVAGAAAIVAQAHPDWTGRQIKAALSSTAKNNPAYTPFQQGNGRVDVPRAVTQQVFATPALSYGLIHFDTTGVVSKEITYSNETSEPVTLNLSSSLPASALTLSAAELSVPAHGTATVTTSVDSGAVAVSRYAGYVTATDAAGAITVRTAVGYEKEAERYNLQVNYLDRNGDPAEWVLFTLLELGGAVAQYGWTSDTDTFRVPPGTYSIGTWISTLDGADNEISTSVVGDAQIEVSGDTTLTLDARRAVELKPVTEHSEVEQQGITTSWRRGRTGVSDYSMTRVQGAWGGLEHVYAAPTEQVTDGFFDFYSKFHLLATELTAEVVSPKRFALSPEYTNTYEGWQPKFTGDRRVQLVAAGNGSAEAFKDLDVSGKAVLVALEPAEWAHDAVVNAAAAGAKYVLAYRKTPGKWFTAVNYTTIPAMTVSGEEGAKLQSLLASNGSLRLELGGTAVSPYIYELVFPETGRIPSKLTYRVDSNNTEKVVTRYYGSGQGEGIGREARFTFRPWEYAALGVTHYIALSTVRTEYYTANDTTYLHRVASDWAGGGEVEGPYVIRRPGKTSTENWLSQVVRPATAADYGATTRTGNRLTVQIPEYADAGDGHHGYAYTSTDTVTTKLSANGNLVGQLSTWAWGTITVPAEEASYTLTVDATRQAPWAAYSTQTSTTWSFRSAQVTQKQVVPLLSIDYGLDLDLLNRARDNHRFDFGLKARHQEGSTTTAAINAMMAWASYDDGTTWKPVDVRKAGGGGYRAELQHPKVKATNGFVALRVQATDADGNKIDQTVKRAYGLRD